MTNKQTNKKRGTKVTSLPWHHHRISPLSDSPRTIMRDTWRQNKTRDEQGPHADMVTRITDAIRDKLPSQMQLPDFVGVQPMKHPTGSMYYLRYALPSDDYNRMCLEIVSQAIEARSRSLGIRIPFDVISFGGIEDEVVQAAVMEISRDFNEEFMDLIYQNSSHVDFRLDVEEDPDAIIAKIMKACRSVALKSKRGIANNIILPYELYSHILPYISDKGWFQPSNDQSMSDLLNVGTLFNNYTVYVSIRNTVVLLGYKGGTGETDTGIFFCPHSINSHISINPCTFEPSITMNTRHGRFVTKNAEDYYVSIQVR